MLTTRGLGNRRQITRGTVAARLIGRRHRVRNLGRASSNCEDDDIGLLVDEAMKSALAGATRDDRTLGAYASLHGFCHAALMQEGRLVEDAIAAAVRRNPELRLVPSKPLPIVPAAQEMLMRTPPEEIQGVRFPSRVHASETYRPDLFIVNRTRHSALILDVKRSLNSHRPQEIDRLRFRMLAVAAIAPEWIAEHQGPLLVSVETAIVDAADQASDPERGVFRLSEIDTLLETEGTVAFVRAARAQFSRRVQDEIARRCGVLASSTPVADSGTIADVAEQVTNVRAAIMERAPMAAPAVRFGFARRTGVH